MNARCAGRGIQAEQRTDPPALPRQLPFCLYFPLSYVCTDKAHVCLTWAVCLRVNMTINWSCNRINGTLSMAMSNLDTEERKR